MRKPNSHSRQEWPTDKPLRRQVNFAGMDMDFPDFDFASTPGKVGLGSPVGRILDKIGQTWPKLAKRGHGWPNLDKAGQIWTAAGQLFPSVVWCREQPEECQAKTPALFLAGLRGSDSDRPLRSGNETTKKRPQKPALSKIGQTLPAVNTRPSLPNSEWNKNRINRTASAKSILRRPVPPTASARNPDIISEIDT